MTFFFFFKQKTAYEMRISDWSSDVCSSDLRPGADHRSTHPDLRRGHQRARLRVRACSDAQHARDLPEPHGPDHRPPPVHGTHGQPDPRRRPRTHRGIGPRSAEHTSDLQSLMRSAYAVLCLNKTNTKKNRIK